MERTNAALAHIVEPVQDGLGQPDGPGLLDSEDLCSEPDESAECLANPDSTGESATPDEPEHPASPVPPDFERHARACKICSHPNRDAIEGDFVRWRSPGAIAEDHKIADRSSIYRHAHATGLFARRRCEFARVLENILERVEYTRTDWTGVIVSAARVYAHLDERGRWVEPTKTHVVLTGSTASPVSGNARRVGPGDRKALPAKRRNR